MERRRISNFFIPKISKRFTMTVFNESKVENIGGKQEPRRTELSWQIPEGIIDFWRLNTNYTSLLLSTKIDEISNEETSYLIREAVTTSRNHKQEHLKANIHELINQDREMEVDIDNDENDIDIVYTWRTTKLPLSKIAQKHRQSTSKVLKVIKMYKSMVRQQMEFNSRRVAKSRRKIDDKGLRRLESIDSKVFTIRSTWKTSEGCVESCKHNETIDKLNNCQSDEE